MEMFGILTLEIPPGDGRMAKARATFSGSLTVSSREELFDRLLAQAKLEFREGIVIFFYAEPAKVTLDAF